MGVCLKESMMVFGTHHGAIIFLNTKSSKGLVQIFPSPENNPARIQALDCSIIGECAFLAYGSSRGDVEVRFKFHL